MSRIQTAGKALDVEIKPMHTPTLRDVEGAFESMENGFADAVVFNNEQFSVFHQKRLAALAAAKKIPSICDQESFARAGCLLSYTTDRVHMAHRAADFVVRVLKGAKPADLPVEISARYKLVVNLKTARAVGVTLPRSIFLQATEVIE